MTRTGKSVTGVILAGGRSTRMGRDKSRLRLDGETLVERAVGRLAPLFDEVLVVADSADRFDDLGHARIVGDLVPGVGPVGGIYTALKQACGSAVFVVACDMPRLDPGVISRQLGMWSEGDSDALVPVVGGRPEPLHAVYSKRCTPAIEEQIRRGEYRVRALFETVRVRFWEVGPGEARAFANVNTPDDWATIIGTGGDPPC